MQQYIRLYMTQYYTIEDYRTLHNVMQRYTTLYDTI
jgi:hypothetical protein